MPYQFNWDKPQYGFPGVGIAPTMGFGEAGSPVSVLGSTGMTTPGISGAPGGLNASMFGGGLGLNMDTAKLGLAGIGTLGSLWGAFQAASLAKKQFNFTKDITETNLANQLKTYNTALTDRANNRQIVEGRSAADTASYIDQNKLTRYGR